MFSFSKISIRIKTNEGFNCRVYKDLLGNQTIGYGHLINSKDTFYINKKYSKTMLTRIFYSDLKGVISDFKRNYHYKILPDCVQEVIIEMIFQLGIINVLEFKKFNYFIKKKQYYLAALEMIKSRWYDQTPKRANKLIAILLQFDVRR